MFRLKYESILLGNVLSFYSWIGLVTFCLRLCWICICRILVVLLQVMIFLKLFLLVKESSRSFYTAVYVFILCWDSSGTASFFVLLIICWAVVPSCPSLNFKMLRTGDGYMLFTFISFLCFWCGWPKFIDIYFLLTSKGMITCIKCFLQILLSVIQVLIGLLSFCMTC